MFQGTIGVSPKTLASNNGTSIKALSQSMGSPQAIGFKGECNSTCFAKTGQGKNSGIQSSNINRNEEMQL